MAMKVKKVTLVTVSFFIFSLVCCIVLGFVLPYVPVLISSTSGMYRFLYGLRIFCSVMPAVLETGFLIGWSLDFGAHPDGSLLRFSPAMFSRYKKVITGSLAAVFIISMAVEVALPGINGLMNRYSLLPSLHKEYLNFAEGLYSQGRYSLSYEFAKMAYEIDSSDGECAELLDKAEVACRQFYQEEKTVDAAGIARLLSSGKGEVDYGYKQKIVHSSYDEPFTTFSLLKKARECAAMEDWFGAHYYSQTALSAISPRDINCAELKHISADAWNHISQAKEAGTTDEQKIFAQKLSGYNALMEQDNLKAYYIFKMLSLSSKKISLDPDVVRYLEIAEERLQNQYFFTDETVNLQGFESAGNIYFKITGQDGGVTVYFIKGVTNAGTKNGLIQYLRGLSVYTLDFEGNYISGSYTPYAKMTAVSTELFDDELKKEFGIADGIKYVPYILLNSVDRNREGEIHTPQVLKGDSPSANDGFIILPVEFTDFSLLKSVSGGVESMGLQEVYRFVPKAEKYGFVEEVFRQTLVNRLLYPLFMLICMVCVGIGAWHGRISADGVFKFKWIIVFPLLSFVLLCAYYLSHFVFRMINYSLMSICGQTSVVFAGLFLYLVIFFGVSVMFLACKNSMSR